MKPRRTWVQINTPARPLVFCGLPALSIRPSSFSFEPIPAAPEVPGTGRLDYRDGWTAITLWNGQVYFADEILTFDAMIELISDRFNVKLSAIHRDFGN